MRFVTAAGMKRLERALADTGVSYQAMMEAAGRSAAGAIRQRWPVEGRRVLVLCGKGNNGGDGFVAARYLAKAGAAVTVALLCGRPATPESAAAFAQLPPGVAVTEELPRVQALLAGRDAPGLVIDAVFGTGFTGEVPEALVPVLDAARRRKRAGVPVAALDLPSGVEADTGRDGGCVPADLTVAFGAVKPAHLVNWAGEYAGEVVLGEIGLTPAVAGAFDGWEEAIDSRWAAEHRPRRSHTGHKGSNGRLLVVAGCRKYPGAAVLATLAASRSGAGYVQLASTARVGKIAACHCAEAIHLPLDKEAQGGISGGEDNLAAIQKAAQSADTIAIGCGMEPGEDTRAILQALLRQPKPLVVDAGAITALAGTGEALALLQSAACPVVLTPHPGEYARLTGQAPEKKNLYSQPSDAVRPGLFPSCCVKNPLPCLHHPAVNTGYNPFDREYTIAKEAGVTLLLKGWATVVTGPDGRRRWSFAGCDGLAKGGSGDVLTGIIGGLLARGMAPEEAALWGAWLHGEAARLCAGEHSRDAMLPSQLPGYFGRVFLEAEAEGERMA